MRVNINERGFMACVSPTLSCGILIFQFETFRRCNFYCALLGCHKVVVSNTLLKKLWEGYASKEFLLLLLAG